MGYSNFDLILADRANFSRWSFFAANYIVLKDNIDHKLKICNVEDSTENMEHSAF